MSQTVALVTGAGGEVGHLLIPALRARGFEVVALDLVALPPDLAQHCRQSVEASILDSDTVKNLVDVHQPSVVFHLAALLSAKAEREPKLAHQVNVEGSLLLIEHCRTLAQHKGPVRFVFPSSIAVYGLPDAATKERHGAVAESEWTVPSGIYGCNKLYVELLGSAMARHDPLVDFRSLRYPGLISADTLPTSGTTDYAPAMIHAAARGEPYTCFVNEPTRLPFMTMPDAVAATLQLASVEPDALSTRVYNFRGFSATAEAIRTEVTRHFPSAKIDFEPIPDKQALVDSWPADVDDQRARDDLGFEPTHDLAAAFDDYLVPAVRRRYGASASQS